MSDFVSRLRQARPMVLDGGLATELERRGHDLSHRLWSARLLVDDPVAIRDVHRAWLDAGAECVITASYQAGITNLMDEGLSRAQVEALLRKTIELAKEARDEFRSERSHSVSDGDASPPRFVAASIGPYGATLADGSEYRGDYGVTSEELRDFHAPRWELLEDAAPDVFACETIPDHYEANVLVELARQSRFPVWLSLCCLDGKHLADGTPLREIASMAAECSQVAAVGVNCTAPTNVESLVAEVRDAAPRLPIVVYPNSGETWDAKTRSWMGDADATGFADRAVTWREAGASAIGGCCRTTTDHIRRIADVFRSGN